MSIVIAHEELLDGSVRQKIAERAYFIAEQQGFAPGHEETNWFMAEAEVMAALQSNGIAPTEAVVAKVKKLTTKKAAPKADATEAKTAATATPRKRVSKKSE